MRFLALIFAFAIGGLGVYGEAAPGPVFEVASVRQSQRAVGPDYNNQISYTASGFTARNATLRRLVAEAYRLQLNQVVGPEWLDRNEYDVEARTAEGSGREQTAPMLRSLLAERFKLTAHRESREMRVYELVVGPAGAKIHPVSGGDGAAARAGFHFHGEMQRFADLLAVQLSIPMASDPSQPMRASGPPIPVLDKTGLAGTYDFSVEIHPELGTDLFTLWQRTLEDQLGLRLENRKATVEVLVVDGAEKTPTEN